MLISLDLLEKKEGTKIHERRNPSYTTQYMRYKRILNDPKSGEHENEPLLEIRKQATKLLKRNITTDEFRQSLKAYGIDPQIQQIKKLLNEHESGDAIKFHDLFTAVVHNKDEVCVEPKFKNRGKKIFKTTFGDEFDDKNIIEIEGGHIKQMAVKRRVNEKLNSYHSNKEYFDWDLNTLKRIKSGENNNTQSYSKNNPVHKNVYLSNIFNNDSDEKILSSIKNKRTSTAFFSGSGDILSWKGQVRNEELSPKGYKRRNPNEKNNDNIIEKKPKKIFTLLSTSKENTLNLKSK